MGSEWRPETVSEAAGKGRTDACEGRFAGGWGGQRVTPWVLGKEKLETLTVV